MKVPVSEVERLSPEFLTSVVTLENSDVWCDANQRCKNPAEHINKDDKLSVLQVWSTSRKDNPIVSDIDGYRQGMKTISGKKSGSNCSASSRGTYGVNRTKIEGYCSFNDRLDKWSPPISSYGFVHSCDTMKGASGAPIFSSLNLTKFKNNPDLEKIPLTGVHRAGQSNAGNCAVPASLATPYFSPYP